MDVPVELLYFAGCPHAGVARTNLEAALQSAGRHPRWHEWDLEDPRIPAWASGYASPTVLVEGRDVTGQGPSRAGGLACRSDGAPTVMQIAAALSAAGSTGGR